MARRIDKAFQKSVGMLFPLEACRAEPSVTSRLLALAATPPMPRGDRQRRLDEDEEMLGSLQQWGKQLAATFRLRPHVLHAEKNGVTDWYGICYDDGEIRIRLRHAKTGKLLKESSLVDTLCHELAHLRHFDHSIRFRTLYRRILEKARSEGIYRPGPGEEGPKQLGLYEGACATQDVRMRKPLTSPRARRPRELP